VKLNPGGRRLGAVSIALTAAAAMLLTACSSSKSSGAGAGDTTANGSTTSAPDSSSASGGPAVTCPSGGTLKAEGSTAQQNAINQWIKDYQTKCSGTTINYNGTGSGAGVKQFNGGQVDFAGSDSALNAANGEVAAGEKRCGSPALDLPMVVGPIAVAFKVKGVDDAALTLTPSVTAKIFTGKITKWNDPAITALNSGVTLPDENITVFFRSDESGTTQNFETYLNTAAPDDYTAKPSKTWAGVGQGKAKSAGVQAALTSTEGSIGYIEWSYAVSGGLATAKIDNGGGAVALDADTASAAAGAATVVGTGNDVSLKLDYKTTTAGAYPIILVTYEIVCTKYSDPKVGAFVKSFLSYTAGDGQNGLKDLGYAPLPDSVKTKVDAAIAVIS
jgi:phosphate transport system substrate-binding protein